MVGVSIGLWRASIGRFYASYKSYYEGKRKPSPQFFTYYASLMAYLENVANQCISSKYSFFGFLLWYLLISLCCVGILRKTRDLKPSQMTMFLYVNNIPSHNFQKIAVLENFVAMHRFDIICILETFLNNT